MKNPPTAQPGLRVAGTPSLAAVMAEACTHTSVMTRVTNTTIDVRFEASDRIGSTWRDGVTAWSVLENASLKKRAN